MLRPSLCLFAALTVAATPALPASAAPALADLAFEQVAPAGTKMPRFKVDAAWPAMPDDLMLGQVSGVAVDGDDDVWVVHRPQSLTPTDVGAAQTPPIALCCKAAPPVVRFAKDGRYLAGWGGADAAPKIGEVTQWPTSLHGIFVDDKKTVWFGGNGKDDHVVLNYTADGRFIRAIGKRGETGGNLDQGKLGNPSDVNVSEGEVLVSDGYTNKRVVGFDAGSLAFRGVWGPQGQPPAGGERVGAFDPSHGATSDRAADPDAAEFGGIVHCAVPAKDGTVYVCDRQNNRAQMYRRDKTGRLTFVKTLFLAGSTKGTGTVTDIAFSPDAAQTYMYVADMMNGRIWILLRKTHEILGSIGRIGRQAGQFTWLHSIATDSEGNIYTTEVSTGRRVQKLVFTGVE